MENLEKFKEEIRTHVCRAKRLDNGEWVYGNLILSGDANEGWEAIIIPVINSHMVHNPDFNDLRFGAWFQVDPKTICHCVGKLCDKYVWENDIVKKEFYTDYDNCANSEEYIGVVKITDCAWVIETIRDKCIRPIFEAMSYSEDVKHFEIIGNVFDNPELL